MDRETTDMQDARTGFRRSTRLLLLTCLTVLPGCRAAWLTNWCSGLRQPPVSVASPATVDVESEAPGPVKLTPVHGRASTVPVGVPGSPRSAVPPEVPLAGEAASRGHQLPPYRERFRRLRSALRESETGPAPPPPPVPRDLSISEIRLAAAAENVASRGRRVAVDERPWVASFPLPARVTPPVVRLPDISDWGEPRITRVARVRWWFPFVGPGSTRWTLVAPIVLGALVGLFWRIRRRKAAAAG